MPERPQLSAYVLCLSNNGLPASCDAQSSSIDQALTFPGGVDHVSVAGVHRRLYWLPVLIFPRNEITSARIGDRIVASDIRCATPDSGDLNITVFEHAERSRIGVCRRTIAV